MTSYLIDTNCLLSYLTDRSPRQQAAVTAYIEEAGDLALTLTVTPHVFSELVYVLTRVYDQATKAVSQIIDAILNTPGFDYLDLQPIDLITEWWPERVGEYGDAVLAATAHASGLTILTFDKAFAKRLARHGLACKTLAA